MFIFDFDKDNDKDIISVGYINHSNRGVYLIENYNSGNFLLPRKILDQAVDYLYFEDINNDGYQDIVAKIDNSLLWYSNDGTFNFSVSETIEDDLHFEIIDISDIDGDNDIDICIFITYDYDDQRFFWYENDGNGNFEDKSVLLQLEDYYYIKLIDDFVDTNTNKEFIVKSSTDSLFQYIKIDSTYLKQTIDTLKDYKLLQSDDIDSDGDKDLIAHYYDLYNEEYCIGYYRNNNGRFDTLFVIDIIDVSLWSWSPRISTKDIDNDGDQDILFSIDREPVSKSILYENKNNISFEEHNLEKRLMVGNVGDIDNDSDIDIVDMFDKILFFSNNELNSYNETYSLICGGDSIQFGNSYLSESGIYYDTIDNSLEGSDISKLELEVSNRIPPTVSISGEIYATELIPFVYEVPFDPEVKYSWQVENGTFQTILPDTSAEIEWQLPGNGKILITSLYPGSGCYSNSELNVTIDLKSLDDIFFYPNPAKNILYITETSQEINIEVYNINGKLVGTSNSKQINLERIAAGSYAVILSNKEGKIIEKGILNVIK